MFSNPLSKKMNPLNNSLPKVIWLTGLSGAGKSTLAGNLRDVMSRLGHSVYVLDGDILRNGLNQDLGYSDHCRSENIRRAIEVAKILYDARITVIAAFISPFQKDRDIARYQFPKGIFIEVYVNTPIDVCEARDSKGLYKKARLGLISHMTGIDSIYEAPLKPEIEIDNSKESINESINRLLNIICPQNNENI